MRSVLIGLCFLVGFLPAPVDNSHAARTAPEYIPGEVLVKFKKAPVAQRMRALKGIEAEEFASFSLPPEAQITLGRMGGRVEKAFPHHRVLKVRVHESVAVEDALNELRNDPEVEYAEPNYILRTQDVPVDPGFDKQWALADIEAPQAWSLRKNGAGGPDGLSTIVAVIDTGVDYRHNDLAPNMWVNPGEVPGDRIDNDGNGYVDDIYGIDAANNDSNPMDDEGHGTHCAGIIGAAGDSGIGITGVNWKASIMALKFMDASGAGTVADVIECIQYAVDIHKDRKTYRNGRMILSNSWGGGGYSKALYDAIQTARDAGVLFVIAAGNEGQDLDRSPSYPAGFGLGNIITVGASDKGDLPASFSNIGAKQVDLFAPGVSILSTLPRNKYGLMSGTSMACPFVSGACALSWSKAYRSSWKEIKNLIVKRVDPKPELSGKCASGGRLNLYNSMRKAVAISQNK